MRKAFYPISIYPFSRILVKNHEYVYYHRNNVYRHFYHDFHLVTDVVFKTNVKNLINYSNFKRISLKKIENGRILKNILKTIL